MMKKNTRQAAMILMNASSNLFIKFINNKKLIIFICIFISSISITFIYGMFVPNIESKVIFGMGIFSSSIGLWYKLQADQENKSKSVEDLEFYIDKLINKVNADIGKLDMKLEAIKSINDNRLDNLDQQLVRQDTLLTNHLKSLGHIETEKQISHILAKLDVFSLNLAQVTKEYEKQKQIDSIFTSLDNLAEELIRVKGFLKSDGFIERRYHE